MDINVISQLIGNFGFPIVCCGFLFWQQNKTLEGMSTKIDNAIQSLDQAIEKNTVATTTLVTTVNVLAKAGENDG